MAPGDRKKLMRKTFLHNGIFVFQGQQVVVQETRPDGVVVEYMDREGHPHLLEGVDSGELVD
ncbi:MAG: hypothetical protein K1X75_03115 [Leptospirales bacterium]|nr:hypothetical protein [Leptospirales bacterium]